MSVGVNGARERRTKPGEVRAAVDGVDVVGEGIDFLVVGVVVLDSDFDRQRVANLFEVDRFVVKNVAALVEMLHEFGDAAAIVELVRLLWLFAFIFDRDANAFVEKGFLAETLR